MAICNWWLGFVFGHEEIEMSIPTIILDLDGVLNSTTMGFLNGYDNRSMDLELDSHSISILNVLLNSLPTHQIVVCSSWRKHSDFSFQQLIDYGIKGNFVDVTPVNNDAHFRGDEVQEWLDAHPDVTTFVCFDDGTDFYPHQNLIRTDAMYGIRLPDIYKALKILDPNVETTLHSDLITEFYSIPVEDRSTFIPMHYPNLNVRMKNG